MSSLDPLTFRLSALYSLIMFQPLPLRGREDESFVEPGLRAAFRDPVRLLTQVGIELDPGVQRGSW